jgi:uncharacterized protein (DUF1330 family)
MSVYAVGLISIHDRQRYERYRRRFMDVLLPFGGRLLAADERPRLIRGAFARDKVILIEFDDDQAFHRWFESPEYRSIALDREAAATGEILLVNGVGEAAP